MERSTQKQRDKGTDGDLPRAAEICPVWAEAVPQGEVQMALGMCGAGAGLAGSHTLGSPSALPWLREREVKE